MTILIMTSDPCDPAGSGVNLALAPPRAGSRVNKIWGNGNVSPNSLVPAGQAGRGHTS